MADKVRSLSFMRFIVLRVSWVFEKRPIRTICTVEKKERKTSCTNGNFITDSADDKC